MKFSEFAVGQYVTFQRRFTVEDYRQFLVISGDENPLHADDAYAAVSEFGERIVPLALAVSPCSAIAGMAIPGKPSVILSQTYDARRPVFFDRDLVFSGRIESVSTAVRTIRLNLRVFEGCEKLIEGRIVVKARQTEWDALPNVPAEFDLKSLDRTAFVSGADGEIGRHCALRLENAGWRVIRHSRKGSGKDVLLADFCDPQAHDRLTDRLRQLRPSLIVHCASSGVHDGLADLVASNFQALSTISQAVLPGMCAQQAGRFIIIGSIAQRLSPPDMYNYAAAKAQSGWLMEQLQQKYSADGITAAEILCDKVDTAFSEGLDAVGGVSLDPEEVADHVAQLAERPIGQMAGKYLLNGNGLQKLHPARTQAATTGCAVRAAEPAAGQPPTVVGSATDQVGAKLKAIFKRHLPSSENLAPENMTMQEISGWDSLKQIILALEVEKAFDISLATAEISGLTSFHDFKSVIERSLGGA